jgi:hypothetical protein
LARAWSDAGEVPADLIPRIARSAAPARAIGLCAQERGVLADVLAPFAATAAHGSLLALADNLLELPGPVAAMRGVA